MDEFKTIKDQINTFVKYQDVAEITKKRLEGNINKWHEWLIIKGIHHKEVTKPIIIRYKKELLENGRSPLTVQSYISAIKRYYKWQNENSIYPINPGEGVLGGKRYIGFRRKPLNRDQVSKLLGLGNCAKLDSKYGSDVYITKEYRDHLIMSIMVFMGLRVVEIVRLDVEDVIIKYTSAPFFDLYLNVLGKGKVFKESIKVPEAIKLEIRRYAEKRKSGALFYSMSNRNRDGRLTTNLISTMIKSYMVKIGLVENFYSAHSLRHTTGVLIMKEKRDIYFVKNYLRHTDINMTLNYLRYVENEDRANSNVMDEIIKANFEMDI